jgi:hypothetical protein
MPVSHLPSPISRLLSPISTKKLILHDYLGFAAKSLLVGAGCGPPAPRAVSFKLSTADFKSINLTEDSQVYLFLTKRISHNN